MIKITEGPSIKVVGETSLKLEFDYNPAVIDIVRSAGDAVWNKKLKLWEVPLNKLSYLIDNLTYIDEIALSLMESKEDNKMVQVLSHKTELYPHQTEGISWIINNKNGLLLDAPGLGKSIQTIYAAEELKAQEGIEHCLIICGINSLKTNWEKEIEKHSTLDSVIIGKKVSKTGRVSYASVADRADQLYNKINEFFVIINVESLRDSLVIDAIKNSKNKFDLIVFDEVHKSKDPKSQQGKNLLKLSKVGSRHLGLTGTLLVNDPLDSFVPLKFINKERSTWTNFKNFYCNFDFEFGHRKLVGFKNINILKDTIESCSLRRSKDMLQLPPKNIIPEYVEMSDKQSKFYHDIEKGVVSEADRVDIKTSSLLGLVIRERQAATCPGVLSTEITDSCKIDRAFELAEEIISTGEKVVIFSTFKEPLNVLYDRLKRYNPLLGTGDLDDATVSRNIDLFQNDNEHMVFLATASKCGTGITLNRATYAIFLDSTWTASLETQLEDRIHRISNTKPVFIYKLIAAGTIDERIQRIIERKRGISDYVIDNKKLEREEIIELLGL